MRSILIDTSNILYRGFYSFPKHPCGEVFFILTTIRSYLNDLDTHVYLCLDGKAKGKQINEEYKANRKHEDAVSVFRHLPYLVYMLQDLNRVHIKYNPNLEADEVIFSLTRILEGDKIIISTDNDLLQSLKEDTCIQRQDKLINEQYYREEMTQKFHSVTTILLTTMVLPIFQKSTSLATILSGFSSLLLKILIQATRELTTSQFFPAHSWKVTPMVSSTPLFMLTSQWKLLARVFAYGVS